jgi:hypothetical protein
MRSIFRKGQSVTIRNPLSPSYSNFGKVEYIDQAGRIWITLYGHKEPQPFRENELVLTRDMIPEEA